MQEIAQLQNFGLSEKEAAVYAAALTLGPATADQLSKQSGIKRSTTYVQIESLQEMGLMSNYEEGKKTFYAPESPQNLERVLEREQKELELKQSELKKLLPDLTNMFEGAGERPVVRFYQGKEGIVSVREEMLNVTSKETFVIFTADEMEKLFTDEERDIYTKRRDKNGIKLNLLYTRTSGPFQSKAPKSTRRKYLGAQSSIGNDIVIYDDKVAFFSMTGKIFCIVIESRKIRETMLALFYIIWNTTE